MALSLKIAIGSDHAGYLYKEKIKEHLQSLGHAVQDFGTDSTASCDYPKFIRPTAEAVAKGEADRGIVLGGSGNGEAIVANKVKGIRCAVVFSLDTARWAKAHNDANVISIGERTIPIELALQAVTTWLETEFEGGRHAGRIAQIEPA
jgi:ribose 5-phosphate isomerase B